MCIGPKTGLRVPKSAWTGGKKVKKTKKKTERKNEKGWMAQKAQKNGYNGQDKKSFGLLKQDFKAT